MPSGYQKMIRARIEGRVEGALWMFEPVTQDSPCHLADAILDGSGGACQTLIIQNLGTDEIHLKPGTVLGSVTVIYGITSQNPTVVSGAEEGGAEGQTLHDLQPQVCTVVDAAEEQERTSRLLGQLNLKLEHLSSEERSELEDTILSYSHTFASGVQ